MLTEAQKKEVIGYVSSSVDHLRSTIDCSYRNGDLAKHWPLERLVFGLEICEERKAKTMAAVFKTYIRKLDPGYFKTAKPKKPKVQSVSIGQIDFDESIQPRVQVDQETLDNYAELIENKVKLPRPDVFKTQDGKYLIGDGWHRIIAHRLLNRMVVSCNVHEGGREAAIKMALKANTEHGLRRTNADKRKAVMIALNIYSDKSDRSLADMCAVSNVFVSKLRKQVLTVNTSRTGKDGKKYPGSDENPSQEKTPEQLVLSFKEDYLTPLISAQNLMWKKADPRIKLLSKKDFEELHNFHKSEAVKLKALIKEMS